MSKIIEEISRNTIITNDLCKSCVDLLMAYEMSHVANHVEAVSNKSVELAAIYKVDKSKLRIAGYFHDVSCVIPNENRVEIAREFNIELYKEELEFPMIIHQKLSKEIACRIFGIIDKEILDSIACHTTLRSNCTKSDMILFIADKISWDQPGEPPYLSIIMNGLNETLEKGVFNFIDYLIVNKSRMKVVHPWLLEAYEYLKTKI